MRNAIHIGESGIILCGYGYCLNSLYKHCRYPHSWGQFNKQSNKQQHSWQKPNLDVKYFNKVMDFPLYVI